MESSCRHGFVVRRSTRHTGLRPAITGLEHASRSTPNASRLDSSPKNTTTRGFTATARAGKGDGDGSAGRRRHHPTRHRRARTRRSGRRCEKKRDPMWRRRWGGAGGMDAREAMGFCAGSGERGGSGRADM